jgi:hypothetical protein
VVAKFRERLAVIKDATLKLDGGKIYSQEAK